MAIECKAISKIVAGAFSRPFRAWPGRRGEPRATLVPRFALGWLAPGLWPSIATVLSGAEVVQDFGYG
jgi:hypothetical protein